MRALRSIRAQLAVGVGVLVLLIVALAGVAIVAQMDARDRAALDAQLQYRADRVGEDLGKVLGEHGASTDAYGDLLAGSQSLVRIIADGAVVAERGEVAVGTIPLPVGDGLATLPIDGADWRSLVVSDASGVDVQVLQSLAPLNERLTANTWLVALVTAAATALAIAGGWIVASLVLRPMRDLTTGARRIRDAHDIADRLPSTTSPAEVAELSATLNDMLERLEQSTNATRRFTADAGHELRTPLAGVAANLEILARNPGLAAEARQDLIESARAELLRSTALLDGLQRLARGDAGALPERESVDIADLAAEAVRGAQRRHPDTCFSFEAEETDASLPAWRDGLRLAIDNLLDNAALHGRADGRVVVTVRSDPDATSVVVADDGPGIPPALRYALRERFARGADATAPGSGLGLALVDQQADLHGGALELGESAEGGLAASLILPRRSREDV